jgi:carboxymethylenebutenolidase
MTTEKTIEFTRPDGKPVPGFLVEAASPKGAVVVIQEWWGLNDQIRGVARRFAQAGFTALVPDLYRGQSTVEAEEAHHLMSGLNFGEAASQDIRGAVQHLKTLPGAGKVGVTGYCMGGALTVLTLTMAPEADAGVVWYGYPPLEYVDASRITAPVMAHWATQDAPFPIAGVDALEARLAEAGVRYEGHRYLAHHGFANETAQGPGRIAMTQYDAAWAQQAWDRTLRFFGATLA